MRARLLALAKSLLLGLVLGPGLTACSTTQLKAEGEPCFASSECDVGLTCDFGVNPSVCGTQQTGTPGGGTPPDAAIAPDAGPGITPDAAPGEPLDAAPEPPDAAPEPPDAAPEPPDAAPEPPDAAPEPPDAAA